MDDITCPHCKTTMAPATVSRGPTAGMPKCTACGKTIRPQVEAEPQVQGEQTMPTNPNDPPELGVQENQTRVDPEQQPPKAPERRRPTMPEQAIREPDISPPPTLAVAEDVKPVAKGRQRTEVEDKWYQYSRRVKRIGGLCKGMHPSEEAIAIKLAKELGTDVSRGWSDMPYVPGLLNASHSDNQKALFEKPLKMVQVVQS